jgi:hypothetical protein
MCGEAAATFGAKTTQGTLVAAGNLANQRVVIGMFQ